MAGLLPGYLNSGANKPNALALGEESQGRLTEQTGRILIRSVSMDSNEHGHCLAVLYEQARGPAYRTQVVYSTRHDGVEAAANNAMDAEVGVQFSFVAVGSNNYGHCLVLVGTAG